MIIALHTPLIYAKNVGNYVHYGTKLGRNF